MKIRNSIILSCCALAALGVSSCSTLNLPFGNSKNASQGQTSNANNSSKSDTDKAVKKTDDKTEKKEEKKNDKKGKKPAVLPTDRESLHDLNQKEYSAKDLEEGVVTGDWTIEEIADEKLNPGTAAYLKFVPKEHRVYGNNGCNTINASYTYNPAEHQLSFSNVLSTMRLCPNIDDIDERINLALNNTKGYQWSHSADEYYLYFYDDNGNRLLTLMHQTFDFLNGAWQVSAIEEDPINEPEMRIVIDVEEMKIHGNTGCNLFNGQIDIDMETANTIAFHDIVTTRMACENPENQTRLIVALEDAAHAKPVDENTVVLLNLLNQPVLTLKRL